MQTMRVFISGADSHGGLANSYARACEALDCDVFHFDDQGRYQQQFSPINNSYTHRFLWRLFARPLQRELIETVDRQNPDLILILKGWFFKPETIRTLKKNHPETPIFCFNQENPFRKEFAYSNQWIVKSIPHYDAYFTWGEFLIEELEEAGANRVTHVPFAHDPALHYPVNVTEEEHEQFGSDITFIGTWSRKREKFIRSLLDYDIQVWGNMWNRADADVRKVCTHEAVYGEGFSKVCNSSKVVVDILREQMVPSHSMKCFEIPACGAFFTCNPGHELDQFYDIGEEIVTFETPEDLRSRVEHYLNHDNDRARIADRGKERVKEHTYKRRAKTILDVYTNLD